MDDRNKTNRSATREFRGMGWLLLVVGLVVLAYSLLAISRYGTADVPAKFIFIGAFGIAMTISGIYTRYIARGDE